MAFSQEGTYGVYQGKYLENYEECDCALDTVYSHWYTKNVDKTDLIEGKPWIVPLKETVDRWNSFNAAQYKASWDEAENALRIDFINQLGEGEQNFAPFNLIWADIIEDVANNYNMFDLKGGELKGPIYSFKGKPVNIWLEVYASADLNLRVDLIDGNGRYSNDAPAKYNLGTEDLETVFYTYSGDFSAPNLSGRLTDGWSGDFWGVKNGRMNGDPDDILLGMTGEDAAVMLDPDLIVGTSLYIDDGKQGLKGDEKTLWIRNIQLGGDAPLFDGESTRALLNDAIANAKTVIENAEVGDETGQYPQTDYDDFKTAINAAITVVDATTATAEELNGTLESLKQAYKLFEEAKVLNVVDYKPVYDATVEMCDCPMDEIYESWEVKRIDDSEIIAEPWLVPIKEMQERWISWNDNQYAISWDETKNALRVDFENQNDKYNYDAFTLMWSHWINGDDGEFRPFDEDGSVLAGPIYSYGKNDVNVWLQAETSDGLNLRVDLGDGHGRMGNYIAPNLDFNGDQKIALFSYSGTDMYNGPNVNKVGVFADGWSPTFNGFDNGRHSGNPPLEGKEGKEGMVMVDRDLITSIFFVIDNGALGKLGEKKTLWIKGIQIGGDEPVLLVDNTQLVEKLTVAKELYDKSKEVGNYPALALTLFNAAITDAMTVAGDVYATKEELLTQVVALDNSIQTFLATRIDPEITIKTELKDKIIMLFDLHEEFGYEQLFESSMPALTDYYVSSDDPAVAKIAFYSTGFVVEHIGIGSTTITVEAKSGDKLVSQSYVLTVSNEVVVECEDLIITGDITDVDCSGDNSGKIEVSVTGGAEPYNYKWSTGRTDAFAVQLSAGTYSVTVTDKNNCAAHSEFSVAEPTELVTVVTRSNPKCGGDDGKMKLIVSGGAVPYAYEWQTGETTELVEGKSAGLYTVKVTDANGCVQKQTVELNNQDAPNPVIDGVQTSACTGQDGEISVKVYGGQGAFSYEWSDGETVKDRSGLAPGEYTLTVTDENGCVGMLSTEVKSMSIEKSEICVVTVDDETGHNLVVWQRQASSDVVKYNVYCERTDAGVYDSIGSVAADALLMMFEDTEADATIRSWRYTISAEDQCGNNSEMSIVHKTMLLQMNQGINGEVNLVWDLPEGIPASSVIVFRVSESLGKEELATMPSSLTRYIDNTPPADVISYHVGVKLEGDCDPLKTGSGPFAHSISNIAEIDVVTSGVDKNTRFAIYPKPVEDVININPEFDGEYTVEVYNKAGKLMLTSKEENKAEVDVSRLTAGAYFVKVITDDFVSGTDIIKK